MMENPRRIIILEKGKRQSLRGEKANATIQYSHPNDGKQTAYNKKPARHKPITVFPANDGKQTAYNEKGERAESII